MNCSHFRFEVFAYSVAVDHFTIAVRLRILCLPFYFVHFEARKARDPSRRRARFIKYFHGDIVGTVSIEYIFL